jgi:hypothetical protein
VKVLSEATILCVIANKRLMLSLSIMTTRYNESKKRKMGTNHRIDSLDIDILFFLAYRTKKTMNVNSNKRMTLEAIVTLISFPHSMFT